MYAIMVKLLKENFMRDIVKHFAYVHEHNSSMIFVLYFIKINVGYNI